MNRAPTTERVKAIADHMDSLWAHSQAKEVLFLCAQRDDLVRALAVCGNQTRLDEARVQGLLEANNAYLERARKAEDRVRVLEGRIEKARDFMEGVINGKSSSKEERHDGGESSPAS